MADQESAELSQLQQIMQLAQSGDANALPQIAQIVQQMIQAQEQEMKGMGEGQQPEGKPSFKDRLGAAMQAKQQAEPPQQ